MSVNIFSSSLSSSLGNKNTIENLHFDLIGPKHLSNDNWHGNAENHYSVAACLITAVKVLEYDRQGKRVGEYAWAPAWSQSFGFRVKEKLCDPKDGAIFGAIFQDTITNAAASSSSAPVSTLRVVALRGTMTLRDWKTNFRISKDELDVTECFRIAMAAVERTTNWSGEQTGGRKVWLCGHSLGAAIALLTGKHMAKKGTYLDTFLFNPPFILRKVGKFIDGTVGFFAGFLVGAFLPLAIIVLANSAQNFEATGEASSTALPTQQAFTNLRRWLPHLLLNPDDPICKGYIKYFDKLKRKPVQVQPTDEDLNLPYVIPSAKLIINLSSSVKRQHGISQWWDSNRTLRSQTHLR